MSESRSSYRNIFKATSLFGGVQVFKIITGIIRVKFVAVLLGTTGVGIIGLLNAPLQLILSVTGLGITVSAVKDISEAHGSGDGQMVSRKILTLKRWSWFAGGLGALVTFILSPYLSQWTFGDKEYTWAFMWLSITALMQTVSKGQLTIIQGVRRLKDLARAGVYGSILGLFTAVPLYYFFGIKGIVPSLIVTALTSLILSWHFSKKVPVEMNEMSLKDTYQSGIGMVKLGLVITFTGMLGYLTGYILSAFISRTGGVDQVGLYNATWSVIGQSTGLVFAAMTTDYFPRLSSVNKDNQKVTELVNQQTEMVILILAPIIISIIAAMPLIVKILYTTEFLEMVTFARWMIVGIILKGLVWPIGFIFPAKGDLKVFGAIETSAMIFNILSNIAGYHFFGLEGLGVSFILNYLFGLALTFFFAKSRYSFNFTTKTHQEFLFNSLLVSTAFLLAHFIKNSTSYIYLSLVLLVSISYTFHSLNKRMDLKSMILNYFGKNPGK